MFISFSVCAVLINMHWFRGLIFQISWACIGIHLLPRERLVVNFLVFVVWSVTDSIMCRIKLLLISLPLYLHHISHAQWNSLKALKSHWRFHPGLSDVARSSKMNIFQKDKNPILHLSSCTQQSRVNQKGRNYRRIQVWLHFLPIYVAENNAENDFLNIYLTSSSAMLHFSSWHLERHFLPLIYYILWFIFLKQSIVLPRFRYIVEDRTNFVSNIFYKPTSQNAPRITDAVLRAKRSGCLVRLIQRIKRIVFHISMKQMSLQHSFKCCNHRKNWDTLSPL